MTAQEESIYSLIPKEEVPAEKKPRYKSKYPSDLPPTYSTFCLKTTSMPGVANVPGSFQLPCGPHKPEGMNATFGLPKGGAKPDAARFTKKGTGTMRLPERILEGLHDRIAKKFEYKSEVKRAPIPHQDEKPIMGLVSEKNFIVSNAVENILAGKNVAREE